MLLLKRLIAWLKDRFFAKELEISVVGLQNAGKSTLINTIQTGGFDEDSIPTIGVNIRTVRKGKVQIKIWDLGGQRRYRESWEKYCASSDCIIFVVDASEGEAIPQAKEQLDQLLSWSTVDGIPLLVLANKNDLPGVTSAELADLFRLQDIKGRKVCCLPVSAKSGANIDAALKWMCDLRKLSA